VYQSLVYKDEKDIDVILKEEMKIAGLTKDVMSPW